MNLFNDDTNIQNATANKWIEDFDRMWQVMLLEQIRSNDPDYYAVLGS